jgi:hypothetical protein
LSGIRNIDHRLRVIDLTAPERSRKRKIPALCGLASLRETMIDRDIDDWGWLEKGIDQEWII